MAIDWITVSAQIVNFLFLVWLLKRFLYQPVMRAMEHREQRIADRLKEAEGREQLAEEKAHDYQNKAAELERTREQFVTQAKQEAEQQKRQMLDQARDEVTESRKHWQRQTNQEKGEFLKNLQKQAADIIQAIARKTLADLANADLEEQIVQAFMQRLKSLDDKDLRKALRQSSAPVNIVSAFELSASTRGRLTRAIHEYLVDGIEVEYDESPDLGCGIELTAEGRRLSWNLDEYLEQLSGRVEEAFSSVRAVA